MNKIKTTSICLLVVFLGAACTQQTTTNTPLTPLSPSPTTISEVDYAEFEGTVTGYITDCAFDAECAVIIDKNIRVVTVPGMVPANTIVGSSSIGENDIGKKVKVKAKKTGENTFTLVGDKTLYILLSE